MIDKKEIKSVIADLFVPFAFLVFLFFIGFIAGGIKVALIMSALVLFMGSFVIGVVWLNEKVRDWAER